MTPDMITLVGLQHYIGTSAFVLVDKEGFLGRQVSGHNSRQTTKGMSINKSARA